MTIAESAPASPPARRTVEDLDAGHRTALADLVEATHRFNLAVATTDVDEASLADARRALDALSETLEERTRERCLRTGFQSPGQAMAAGEPYRLCVFNPWGVPFEMTLEGETARAELVANALHEGPADSVHGGVSGWLMDSVLGLLMQAQGRRAVTARLEIDYRGRAPLDRPLQVHARLAGREGRKTWIEGWIEHDGRRAVEARGLFVEVGRDVRP